MGKMAAQSKTLIFVAGPFEFVNSCLKLWLHAKSVIHLWVTKYSSAVYLPLQSHRSESGPVPRRHDGGFTMRLARAACPPCWGLHSSWLFEEHVLVP